MRFLESLQKEKNKNRNVVIPDIKCRSPKEGDLLNNRDAVSLAKRLIEVGAPVLSVVTEQAEFGGSERLLRSMVALGVPVLRKDFLHTKEELERTKELGASAVLLMYSCLPKEQLEVLYHHAHVIGLDVLVETHSEVELAHAAALGARLIGINNRDIRVLERDSGDVSLTLRLADKKPTGAFLISESSLDTPQSVRAAIGAGADATLIGTAILRAVDPARFYQKLCCKTQVKLCGMMSNENIRQCAQAEILGFVTEYPVPVPWNLSTEKAGALLPFVPVDCKSCIVTGGNPDKILALADRLQPNVIQLHYKESLEQTKKIAQGLRKRGISLIRTIPAESQARKTQFGIADLATLSHALASMGVTELLMDARGPDNAAMCGTATPLAQYMELAEVSPLPVILAGGLMPDNLKELLDECGADRVDIMTGIEIAPGKKSMEKIQKLFMELGG